MKIKYISPITDAEFEKESQKEASHLEIPGTSIDVQRIPYGTASIESAYDEILASPGIIKIGLEAEAEGFDGIFISCMGDPALDALRELVNIPVVAPCRTSMLYAADLATRFSVITVTDGVVPIIERIAHDVGVAGKLASVKAVNIPVLELVDKDRLVQSLLLLALEAVEKYDAQMIILGCTGMVGVDEILTDLLMERGHNVSVLYPVPIAIRYLESLIRLNMKHSRLSYPKPMEKQRNILEMLEK